MKVVSDACDGCGGIPDGDRIDHILFYHPCEHAVCENCMRRARRKDPSLKLGFCAICRTGHDSYDYSWAKEA
jgi:hypothetical protein